MIFSIVIPTFNRVVTLRQTLTAVTSQDYPDYEIVVVDDGSNDGTPEVMAKEFPNVRYLRQPNRGPAAARNTGIHATTGDIVAFTDDDCQPPQDWLTQLAGGYTRHPAVSGVGGYLAAPDDVLAHNVLARYELYIARTMYGVSDEEQIDGFASPAGGTNNMSYRRTVLAQVNGFDESLRYAAGEDADLKYRVCVLGHSLLYLPVRMVHRQDYSWARLRRQSYARGRGRMQFERLRGRKPNRAMLAARLVRALINSPRDFLTMPERPFAMAKFIEAVWGVQGQWNELAHA
jgi:glycosyltransferase involved in cell wall biosynthesis